jgi:hypothetical protein
MWLVRSRQMHAGFPVCEFCQPLKGNLDERSWQRPLQPRDSLPPLDSIS